ncbi:hypothetical protein [Streptomyces albipurpureus]|nr:hypothetical protein [Streptomyces sp. CWNU-1]
MLGSLVVLDDVDRYPCSMITSLDIRYPVDGDHPPVGSRVPGLT